ncbi:protein DUF4914 [Candidatus Termititenax persephonae]|uniref:Protein DUF4914 n=1 Tax=Candidatus Termititenax persephonae TaxID=2218525 RepID=A0A388TGN3_9BACT|nr:protein DUF4914 [Candidatus Termititenax persephonae]
MANFWQKWRLSPEVKAVLDKAPGVVFPGTKDEVLALAMGGQDYVFEVNYTVPGKGETLEATVVKCRNGLSVNFPEPHMRRRDPVCMFIGDNAPTDKPRFNEAFPQYKFEDVRRDTFAWLSQQKLAVICTYIGGQETGLFGLLIAPENAGCFCGALADIQGLVPPSDLPKTFAPDAIIYLAPVFRHTHFNGRQVVVNNRLPNLHEVFSYNLYPGPSAKKGIYSVLLDIGEREQWLTLHGAAVQVVTPYDNITTILHEGASGSGKSEMLEYAHRQTDGSLLLGVNKVTKENLSVSMDQTCLLRPVTDDMAISHPHDQKNNPRLVVRDAEQAWFIRINHITHYGTDPKLERACIHPNEPLLFLNIDGRPGSTALLWEHIEDSVGKPCPNPRVVLPRQLDVDVVNSPVEVDFRSFGVRAPLCTAQNPTYGILGMLHVLPPALAWLWRLAAPRGDANPSILTKGSSLVTEGVGTFWPFATGKRVNYANLLLDQIVSTPQTRYVLLPNQHIGAWKVGFMPQWLVREFLARRGAAKFKPERLDAARCTLLGYIPDQIKIEGTTLPDEFLRVETQPEVGVAAYDAGAKILTDFFHTEIKNYLQPELSRLGQDIINCCLEGGDLEDYKKLLPMTY